MRRRHPPHAEAQADRHDRRQRFRNGGDRERDREQEHAQHDIERERLGAEQAGREHERADAEHDDRQALAGAVELLLQRRRLLLGGLEQARRSCRLRSACRWRRRRRGRGRRSRPCRRTACSTRSPRPMSPPSGRGFLATGMLSPVSGASSVWRLASSMMRASAGILSPASIRTMSPGTISRAGTRWRSPSRMTLASGAASAISARTDFSARDSCTKPRMRVQDHDDA